MSSSLLLAGVFGLGAPELMLIFMIFLLLFGGAKLPGLAKGLGQSVREFKKAARDDDEEDEDEKKNEKSKAGKN